MENKSFFDGTVLQMFGLRILSFFLIFFTLGIAYPYVLCRWYRWETSHTVIEGRRLRFDGTGLQLFGKWIVWLLLIYITFGIYLIWFRIAVKKWIISHTFFE